MDKKALEIIKQNNLLCLNVSDPSWDDARGYVFDEANNILFFPVSKKYLEAQAPSSFEVVIWSNPRVVVSGQLNAAVTPGDDDFVLQQKLVQGVEPEAANYMVYDQHSQQRRKNAYKLHIKSVNILQA